MVLVDQSKFCFLENIATADLAFEAQGRDLGELFENAALALSEAMVDTKTVSPSAKQEVRCQNETIEGLLFDFLDEIVFLKDSKSLLFSQFKVTVTRDRLYRLQGDLFGEEISPLKHVLRADVKAVTMYQFKVEKQNSSWKARVVLDI